MELLNKELEKIIKMKLGIFNNEEISSEDVQRFDEININNKTFSGKDKGINLQELCLFPNLKRISLSNFLIDNKVFEMLNDLINMETLQLSSCEIIFKGVLNSPSLKKLKLSYCSVRDYCSINGVESLTIVGDKKFNFGKISGKNKIRRLIIQDSRVIGFSTITNCVRMEQLRLEGTEVDSRQALEELKDGRIQVEILPEYKPMR